MPKQKIKIKELKPKIKEIPAEKEEKAEESELEHDVEESFESPVSASARTPITTAIQHEEIAPQRVEEIRQEAPAPARTAETEERQRIGYENARGYESARRAYQAEERRAAATSAEMRERLAERERFAPQQFEQISQGIRQMQAAAMESSDQETKYQIRQPEKQETKKKIRYPWEA